MTLLSAQDRHALQDLVSRYAHAMDDRDVDAAVQCFLPDARLEFASTATVLHGHEEIQAFYARAFSEPAMGGSAASTHMMANTLVTRSDADMTSTVTAAVAYLATSAVVQHADDAGGTVLARGIVYTDRCVRTDDGWRFAERVHRLRWQGRMVGGPAGGSDPLANR